MVNYRNICIYIYIYLYLCILMYMYIHMYRERERQDDIYIRHFRRHHQIQGAKTRHVGRPQVITLRLQNAAARAVEPKSRAKQLFILASSRTG